MLQQVREHAACSPSLSLALFYQTPWRLSSSPYSPGFPHLRLFNWPFQEASIAWGAISPPPRSHPRLWPGGRILPTMAASPPAAPLAHPMSQHYSCPQACQLRSHLSALEHRVLSSTNAFPPILCLEKYHTAIMTQLHRPLHQSVPAP